MKIDLAQLRAEWKNNPLLERLVHLCSRSRQTRLTSLAWCLENLAQQGERVSYQEILVLFRPLQVSGFGRILQPSQRARARFEWTLNPHLLESFLQNPTMTLGSGDLFPLAATLGWEIAVETPTNSEPAGWTRHSLTLRPSQSVELLLPDDLTRPEAQWLGEFLLRACPQPVASSAKANANTAKSPLHPASDADL